MLSNARPKYNVNKVLRWVFCYVGNKLLISPVEKGIFCPKTAKFGSKLAFLVNLGQGMHLVPCWCVGWWLWRAGCISQDTYLLYIIRLNSILCSSIPQTEDAVDFANRVKRKIAMAGGLVDLVWDGNLKRQVLYSPIFSRTLIGEIRLK